MAAVQERGAQAHGFAAKPDAAPAKAEAPNVEAAPPKQEPPKAEPKFDAKPDQPLDPAAFAPLSIDEDSQEVEIEGIAEPSNDRMSDLDLEVDDVLGDLGSPKIEARSADSKVVPKPGKR